MVRKKKERGHQWYFSTWLKGTLDFCMLSGKGIVNTSERLFTPIDKIVILVMFTPGIMKFHQCY